MPRSGSTYTLPASYVAPVGKPVQPENYNGALEDIEDALTASATVSQVGWVLLATKTAAASATIDFTASDYNFALDEYDEYMIVLSSVKNVTDDNTIVIRVGTGATPTWQAGAGAYKWFAHIMGGATYGSGAQTYIAIAVDTGAGGGLGTAAGENLSAKICFSNPEATDFVNFSFESRYSGASAGSALLFVGSGYYATAGAITGIRFLAGTGNIASGKFPSLRPQKVISL